jgi:gas vesicle protein
MAKNTVKRVAVGTLIAGVVGYLAGILTAPKSGKDTRDEIKRDVTKKIKEAENELKTLLADLNKILDEAKKVADKFSGTAKKDLDGLTDSAAEAKEKVRKMLSAVHDGDTEDIDLHTAIKDANAAIERIKEFLKK